MEDLQKKTKNPSEPENSEPKGSSSKRPRHWTVSKLNQADHDLLRDLAKDERAKDRYTAFLEIEKYVPDITDEDLKEPPLSPIRLGLPTGLKTALDAKKTELGKPAIRILIAAAKKWLADKKRNSAETQSCDVAELRDADSH